MTTRLLKIMFLVLLLGAAGHGAAPARAAVPAPGPDPVFSPVSGTTFLTSVGGSMAVAGDFNLDGIMDLAVTNPTAGTVTILLGPGFATPAAGSPQILFTVGTSTLSQPVYLAVGDFDANGSPDLVVVNKQASAATVFKNNLSAPGTVSFTRSVFPIPPFASSVMPVQVAVGDVNGDSKLDFVTANYLGNSVTVFFGDGTGTSFNASVPKSYPLTGAPSGSNPNSVVISDLNRDGKLDLVVGANNGSQVFTFINGGSSTDPFAAPPTAYTIGANPVAAAVADMNGDLNPDVIVSNNGGVGGVPVISVLFGDGTGALGTAPCGSGCGGAGTRLDIPGVGLSPQGVVAGDVNGDGYPDIAVVDDAHGAADGVKIFLGNGLGCFGNTAPAGSPCGTWSPITLPAGSGPAGVGLADVTGDGKAELFVANQQAPGITLFTNNTNGATACASTQAHPAPCIISPATPCIGIDVNLGGVSPAGSAVRGYSVTLKLSAGLTPCAAPAAGGSLPASALVTTNGFLQGSAGQRTTVSKIYQNPDGSYTIDETILDPPTAGPASCATNTSGSGRLFTIYLSKSAIVATSGTVSVTGLVLRDCSNNPLTAFRCAPGSATTITILPSAPAPPTALKVRHPAMPNSVPPGSFFGLDVSWTNPTPDPTLASSTYDIWRAPFTGTSASAQLSGYPCYQGGQPVQPTIPLLYPASGGTGPWVRVATAYSTTNTLYSDPRTSFPAANPRGYWYYAIVRIDPCGAPVAILDYSQTDALSGDKGTLNYYLGDVFNGVTVCVGDNKVDVLDLGTVGGNICATCPVTCDSPIACVDFAPTTAKPAPDGSGVHPEEGRSVPDQRIEAQEIFILGFSLGVKNSPQLAALPAAADHDEVSLGAPSKVTAGGTFEVRVNLKGAGLMHGIAAQLAWDAGVAEPISVSVNELGARQGAIVLMPEPGYVIAIVPGADRAGFLGDGALATVTYRAKATGDPAVTIASLDARDREMRKVLDSNGNGIAPAHTEFANISPNPFQRNVTLGFSLAREGRVDMAVYSVEGRRVKTLAAGTRPAGVYRLEWDGQDESGRSVLPGVYFVRLLTPTGRFSHTLVRIR